MTTFIEGFGIFFARYMGVLHHLRVQQGAAKMDGACMEPFAIHLQFLEFKSRPCDGGKREKYADIRKEAGLPL